MKVLRQIIRGCGTLPHVGSHTGGAMVIVFALMGAVAGLHAGFMRALFGVGFMLMVFGPMYLYGAWDRAEISDRMEAKEAAKAAE